MTDPALPRQMPPTVERDLLRVLGWANVTPAPIDFYLAIRDALVEAEGAEKREASG